MGTLSRRANALLVLCLAAFAAVSCGDPSGSEGGPGASASASANSIESVDNFQQIGNVDLADRGPRCATLSIDSAAFFDNCFDVDQFPELLFLDRATGVLLLGVDSGDVVSFSGGGIRQLTSSEHYVAAQLDKETTVDELKLSVTSHGAVRSCAVKLQAFLECQ